MNTLQTYTAIDFETANPTRASICQIGLVRIENGKLVKRIKILVQPPDNYYWSRFIKLHGINAKKTAHAPTFDQIWKYIEPYITNQNVVAHNGFGFDFQCLNKTLEYYDIPKPDYTAHCTYKIFKRNLMTLCKQFHIPLQQHNALSDAMACAELFMMHQRGVA